MIARYNSSTIMRALDGAPLTPDANGEWVCYSDRLAARSVPEAGKAVVKLVVYEAFGGRRKISVDASMTEQLPVGEYKLYTAPVPPQAVPAEDVAGLVERLKRHYPGEEPMPLMAEAAAALTSISAERDALKRENKSLSDEIDTLEEEGCSVDDDIRKLTDRAEAAEKALYLVKNERDNLSDNLAEITSREQTSEAEATSLRTDAERWRALMSSQRMHFMGCAGIDLVNKPGTTSRNTVDLIPVMKPGEYHHFGMEFWSEHKAFGNPEYPDDFERALLVAYVDDLRARALSGASE